LTADGWLDGCLNQIILFSGEEAFDKGEGEERSTKNRLLFLLELGRGSFFYPLPKFFGWREKPFNAFFSFICIKG